MEVTERERDQAPDRPEEKWRTTSRQMWHDYYRDLAARYAAMAADYERKARELYDEGGAD